MPVNIPFADGDRFIVGGLEYAIHVGAKPDEAIVKGPKGPITITGGAPQPISEACRLTLVEPHTGKRMRILFDASREVVVSTEASDPV